MTPRLLAIGRATPEHTLSQSEIAAFILDLPIEGEHPRSAGAIYRRAGVDRRGSALPGATGRLAFFEDAEGRGPTTGARLERYLPAAAELAERACDDAMRQAGVDASAITHLITVSCTGFAAPGVDMALIQALGLPTSVRRTNIGFMGCHAAINALAVAAAFAESDPDARVLVCCVELCTLHLQMSDRVDASVANALFADGAAAAIIGCSDDVAISDVSRFASVVVPDSADQMAWTIGDHGFEMSLGRSVPDTLSDAVGPWVRELLSREALTPSDIAAWAIHPGGPKVLSAVTSAVELDPTAADVSRRVLAAHGNMSSATVLFIIDEHLRTGDALPMLALAFGPGLAGEAMLLR